MTSRRARATAIVLAGVVGAWACGKQGSPLPPLRPVPARIADLTAHVIDNRIELSFTVPAANADGTTPPVAARVEIYGTTASGVAPPPTPAATPATAASPTPPSTGAAVPTAAQILADRANLRGATAVLPPGGDGAPPAAPAAAAGATAVPRPPAAGERATVVDRIDPSLITGGGSIYYVAVAATAGTRPRRSPASAVVAVPLQSTPVPPPQPTVTYDERTIRVTWAEGTAGDSFRLFDTGRSFDPLTATPVTPAPIAAHEFSAPVVLGQDRCFAVRTVRQVTPSVLIEGSPSPVSCVTTVDRFPPPAPTALQAIQEGTAVTLIWTPSDAADLAGYIVLRGTAETLVPLVREPVTGTTYRDTGVSAGVSYSYVVIAVDRASNASAQSNRQAITVR